MLKTVLRNGALYSMAVIAQKIASVILFPVYTRYLTPGDYGMMEMLDTMTNIASILLAVRIGSALFFYCNRQDSLDKDRYLSTAYLGSVGLTALTAVIALFAGSSLSRILFETPRWALQCQLALLGFGLTLPIEVGFSCLRLFDKPVHYIVASLARLVFSIALNVVLLSAMHLGVLAMLWSNVICSAAFSLYFGFVMYGPRSIVFRPRMFLEMIRYSLPLCLTTLSMFFLHFGDRLFLQRHVPLSEVGIYGVAYKLGMLVAFIQTPFSLLWGPEVFRVLKAEGGKKMYVQIATYFSVFMLYSALVISLFSGTLVQVLATPAFSAAARLIPWIASAYAIRALAEFAGSIFLVSGKTSADGINSLIAASVCVTGYMFFVPAWKVWGAVAATVVGFSTLLVINVIRAQQIRSFPFEWGRISHAAILGLALFGVSRFALVHTATAQVLQACLLTLLFPFALLVTGFFHKEELEKIAAALTNIVRRQAKVLEVHS